MTDMPLIDEQLIAEFACLDPVYVQGIAGAINLGDTFATFYFRLAPKYTDNGVVVTERIPALYLIRPQSSIVCTPDCRLRRWVNGGRPTVLQDQRLLQ